MRIKRSGLLAAIVLAVVMGSVEVQSATEQTQAEQTQTEQTQTEQAQRMVDEAETQAAGNYQMEVSLTGGSGRAAIQSPAEVTVQGDGTMTARIVWSSPYYDYMMVDGQKYEPVLEEEHAVFQIPVAVLDEPVTVIADTIAMSEPHEITYTLTFDSGSLQKIDESTGKDSGHEDQTEQETMTETQGNPSSQKELPGLVYDHSLELQYAKEYTVDYYRGGYALITIGEDQRFLLVPEDAKVPEQLEKDITILQQPLQNLYLVATSAMSFFASLDRMDAIRLSGTDASGWYVEKAREAMEDGSILYAGKYSAPDYERILSENCGLCIQSTMIYHTPEVKEKLESFGIPVLIERSSYESHPLGRVEWIRLYGVLLQEEETADTVFEEQVQKLQTIEQEERTGGTVAFFYISSNGYVNVRKSTDYIARLIELAGGTYAFRNLEGEDGQSTMNMQMEDFYAGAKDADYLIYNSTVDGGISNMSELLQKSELLADFKAVKEGHVWCTTENLFQNTTGLADLLVDIHAMLTGAADAGDCTYFYPLTK